MGEYGAAFTFYHLPNADLPNALFSRDVTVAFDEVYYIQNRVNVIEAPAHAGSSLADFSTLKMEAIRSTETSVHTRSTRRHIPEDGILHSHRCENFKFYIY
jgi:hypothetical protein